MKTLPNTIMSSHKFSKYKSCIRCKNSNPQHGFCDIYPVSSIERFHCLSNNYKYFIKKG